MDDELEEAVVTVDTGRPDDVTAADATTGADVFVLIHGIGVSSRYFERLVPALARRGRVVALDLPGFGSARDRRPARPYTVEDYAMVVSRTIERLHLGACVIVGHSMGAQVAAHLAVTRPEQVARLALVGPVMAPRDRTPLRAGLRLLLDTLRESPRANRLVIADYLVCGPRWYLAVLPSMLAFRVEDAVRGVAAPVTVLRGSRDPIARPDWARGLAEVAPQGRFAEVPGCPHVVMHSAPERVASELAPVGLLR
jgi:pimeloyl-ACP methyl ester carboxylesterase